MKIQQRLFTLDEANQLIPQLETHLSGLLDKRERYRKLHDELFMMELLTQAEHRAGHASDLSHLEEEFQILEQAIVALEKDLQEISKMGCVLRSLEKGWVDFLGRKDEDYIYFCWKRGEKEIRYFHSLQGGMTDRQPIA